MLKTRNSRCIITVCSQSHAKLVSYFYRIFCSAFFIWAGVIFYNKGSTLLFAVDHAILLTNCRVCLSSGCPWRHELWQLGKKKKNFLTWYLLAWRVERVARELYKTSHFQVLQLSFQEFTRKIAIMGKNTTESKEIDKIQVEVRVRSVPDGGWGWLVCLAGFIAQCVVLGIQNNTGIIYKALLEKFKQSKGETSM